MRPTSVMNLVSHRIGELFVHAAMLSHDSFMKAAKEGVTSEVERVVSWEHPVEKSPPKTQSDPGVF